MRAVWCFVIALGCGGGDSDCPDFAQIRGGTFSRTADTLTWTLEVAGIPAELTFDQSAVPSFVEEYSWGVDIDANGDGTHEWEVAAKHYKMDGPERMVTDVIGATQTDLWRIEGAAGTIAGSLDATLSGNTFTFTLDAGEDAGLDMVQASSKFVYRTAYQHGGLTDRCEDSFE